MRVIVAIFLLSAMAANARPAALPVPPIPPDEPPSWDAPVPNLNIVGYGAIQRQPAVTLDTDINHRTAPGAGMGYAPGAHYQIDNDRRWLVLPGIMVHVPLP